MRWTGPVMSGNLFKSHFLRVAGVRCFRACGLVFGKRRAVARSHHLAGKAADIEVSQHNIRL